jgi:membrane protease YdiL (CAAX protease family)
MWIVLVFALIFPSLMAWTEYMVTPREGGGPNVATQMAYGSGKLVQFTLPLLAVLLFTRRRRAKLEIGNPNSEHPGFGFRISDFGFRISDLPFLGLGLAFGLLVAAGIMVLYYVFLRDTSVFQETPAKVHGKLQEFGLDSVWGFALFAIFITVLHSFLEEYYWRWFVFSWLARYLTLTAAIGLSSLAFMAFHVFVLHAYLPGHFLSAVVPLSLCVGIGGAVWAWLYHRSGSLYAPWLSHLVVDAALFVVGYDLFFVRASG